LANAFLSDFFAYGLGSFHVAAIVFLKLFSTVLAAYDGFASLVVNHLCVDVAQAAIDIQTRSFCRSNNIFAAYGYDVSDELRSCLALLSKSFTPFS
jgi:hypothetical protein